MSAINILRAASTAIYRIAVVLALLLIASELSTTNRILFAIGSMLFKVLGGSPT
jgi:hypothetical protein